MVWCVIECAGCICAVLTYLIVLTVQVGFFRIGLYDRLLDGDWTAYLHSIIFQYHCVMIFWSHFKCMTTEPGCLPKQASKL